MKVDDAFHWITTLAVSVLPTARSQGTGFFYQQLAPRSTGKEEQWRKVKQVWVVTNRHVILPRVDDDEVVPDSFSFYLRKIIDDGIVWDPITLDRDQLLDRARFHPNPAVDLCTVRVLDLLAHRIESGTKYMPWHSVSKEQLPGNNKIGVEVADDAVIVGYPRGFYDETNLYPIAKSGIIASRWGADFNGLPCFLVDAKLFPGSSGSIVVSKPRDITVAGGEVFYSKEKKFAFLGVYSGEPLQEHRPIEMDDIIIIRKSGFNVGIVWYGHLVEEIVSNGIQYAPPP